MINNRKINIEKILAAKVSARMEQQQVIRGNDQLFSSEFYGEENEMESQFFLYEMQLQSAEMKIHLAESELRNMLEYTYDLIGWAPGLTSQEDYEISSRKQTYQVFKNYAQYMLDSLAPILLALETVDLDNDIKNLMTPIIRDYQDAFYDAERKCGYSADLYEKRCHFISKVIELTLNKLAILLEEILATLFATP